MLHRAARNGSVENRRSICFGLPWKWLYEVAYNAQTSKPGGGGGGGGTGAGARRATYPAIARRCVQRVDVVFFIVQAENVRHLRRDHCGDCLDPRDERIRRPGPRVINAPRTLAKIALTYEVVKGTGR